MATKNDIQTGIDAAKENDTKSFDPDDVDARKKRIEKARKLLEEYPPEEPSETTQEEVKAEPETTVAGAAGGITRGVSPYATGALLAAPFGLAAGPFAPIGVPGAMAVGAGTVALSEAFTPLVNKALGTNMATPREAMNALLDWAGVAKPTSKTEKILEKVSDVAASTAGVTGTLGQIAKAVPATYGATKGVLTALGEAPVVQGIAAGTGVYTGEKAKEYAKEKGMPKWVVEGVPEYGIPSPAETIGSIGGAIPASILSALSPKAIQVISKSVNPQELLKGVIAGEPKAKQTLVEMMAKESPSTETAMGAKEIEVKYIPIREASESIGVKTPVPAGFGTTGETAQSIAAKAASIPESKLAEQQQTYLRDLSFKMRNLLNRARTPMSGNRLDTNLEDISSLSKTIHSDIQQNISSKAKYENEVYEKIRKKLTPVEGQVSAFGEPEKAVGLVKKRLIEEYNGDVKKLSDMEKDILGLDPKAITPKEEKPLLILPEKYKPAPPEIEYKRPTVIEMDNLKKDLGEFYETSAGKYAYSNAGKYWTKLYRDALIDDIRNSAEQAGVDPKLIKQANQSTILRKEIEDKSIKLFGKDLMGDLVEHITQIGKQAGEGSYAAFDKIINSVPDKYKNDVITSAISKSITEQNPQGILEFSPKKFIQWYPSVKANKVLYDKLFGKLENPEVFKKQLDNFYVISENINNYLKKTGSEQSIEEVGKNALGFRNGVIALVAGGITGGLTHGGLHALGIPSGVAAGITGATASSVAKMMLPKNIPTEEVVRALDQFLSSPEFAKLYVSAKGSNSEFYKQYMQNQNLTAIQRFNKAIGPESAKRLLSTLAQDEVQQGEAQ